MSDEGFHEIQLNGKQLVFLFMAATVVAVVIFLCGVMVGRGVPLRAAVPASSPDIATLDPTASLGAAAQAVPDEDNAPLTTQETLTYPTLLEDRNPPVETLTPARDPAPRAEPLVALRTDTPKPVATASPRATATLPPKPKPAPTPVPAPAAARATAAPAAASPAPAAEPVPASRVAAEPSGNGFVVQVAAVRQRTEADTIARRLSNKGYPAFVTTSGANFRVRVGKFNDRKEAETVAGRLEREEQFKPWITR